MGECIPGRTCNEPALTAEVARLTREVEARDRLAVEIRAQAQRAVEDAERLRAEVGHQWELLHYQNCDCADPDGEGCGWHRPAILTTQNSNTAPSDGATVEGTA